ncbi:peptidase domain-containing ABC transporter [Marinobacterium sp. YM272]|uniref:peptidase domain-containing ABC transporter n=1 Tax=Marinobacterium sp. YM272 TaxID=3421654 RepID=UPI003D7FC078
MSTAVKHEQSVYASESDRLEAINKALGTQRLENSVLARCIAPLMVALDWFGAPRSLLISLPDPEKPIDAGDVARMLTEQGFRVRSRSWSEWTRHGNNVLDSLAVGSVLVSDNGAYVYLGRLDGEDWWHDGENSLSGLQPQSRDQLLYVEEDAEFQTLDSPQRGWFQKLMLAARREISGIMFVSFVINLLTLVISLFTMFVYNTVIPSGATTTLWAVSAGAGIAILGAWALRLARVTLVSRLTGWGGSRISDVAMGKTLGLPLELSARLGVENNLTRLRAMEGLRQWFGGAGGVISADYPFVIIFLVVIAMLGGWIVVVPLTGLVLFALVSWPLARATEARSGRASSVSRKLTEMTTVVTSRLRALRGVRGSALWNRYLADLVAQSVVANRDYAMINSLTRTLAQSLSTLTVLGTMAVGITLVLAGDMSTGGLIATMMLIWRVTTPAQQMFSNLVRVKQLVGAGHQLQRLLLSTGEASNPQIISPVAELKPSVQIDRLYYRYSADREPALAGISFELEAGARLAVVGPNGAGKTTLLELIAGARMPQNGRVLIDNRDYRQFDPGDYRAWHGYLPQMMPGLPISLPQSMRLRHPTASDEEIKAALARVAGPTWWTYFDVESADEALHIRITPWRQDKAAVRGRYIVRMAASIIDNPPLVLLDDPLGDRDPVLDAHFTRLLDELHGKTTVIIATHRPDLIQSSDFIAVIDNGALAHFGPVSAPEGSPSEELAS